MDIGYIFKEDYTPKERRKLLMLEYVRGGLTIFGGSRKQTAKFLGISPRTLRIFMADNPELREQFPANVYTEQKYNPQPKENTKDSNKNRLYKSLLKYQYKIKGKVYDSVDEIGQAFGIPRYIAESWVKNKVTDENDMVILISIPVHWDGSLWEVE